MVDQISSGLVTGHDERDEEHVEFAIVESLAVDLGIDQCGHDVVTRLGAAGSGHLVAQRVDLHRCNLAGALSFGVESADHHVGELNHARPQFVVEAEHRADGLNRHLRCNVVHELALAASRHFVDNPRCSGIGVFDELGNHAWGETLGDNIAVASVLRVVHVEHAEAQHHQRLFVLIGDERRAERRRKCARVAADLFHVGVLGDRPKPRAIWFVVPEHRSGFAEQIELIVRRLARPRVSQKIDVRQVDAGGAAHRGYFSAAVARAASVISIFARLCVARSETPLTTLPKRSCHVLRWSAQLWVTRQPVAVGSIS